MKPRKPVTDEWGEGEKMPEVFNRPPAPIWNLSSQPPAFVDTILSRIWPESDSHFPENRDYPT
jgi:hypothetical protein